MAYAAIYKGNIQPEITGLTLESAVYRAVRLARDELPDMEFVPVKITEV